MTEMFFARPQCVMNDTIISLELGERREGGVRGLCDMVSVNLIINTLAHINANGTQYI